MARRRLRILTWVLAAALPVGLYVSRSLWLAAMGGFLVRADQPAPADVVMVLAGDMFGLRILKGAELVRQGYAPRVFVNSSAIFYDVHEGDAAIPFAVKRGYPASYFESYETGADSTEEEAASALAELRRRKILRVLVVTSDYHTRRARAIFQSAGPDFKFCFVAARDAHFTADGWWKTRPGRKRFLLEALKMATGWAGI